MSTYRSENQELGSDQFVRHQGLLIPPSVLDDWGVSYKAVTQKPGEMMRIDNNVYYYGWNPGASVAEAVNCCEPSWIPSPFYRSWSSTQYRHRGDEQIGREDMIMQPSTRPLDLGKRLTSTSQPAESLASPTPCSPAPADTELQSDSSSPPGPLQQANPPSQSLSFDPSSPKEIVARATCSRKRSLSVASLTDTDEGISADRPGLCALPGYYASPSKHRKNRFQAVQKRDETSGEDVEQDHEEVAQAEKSGDTGRQEATEQDEEVESVGEEKMEEPEEDESPELGHHDSEQRDDKHSRRARAVRQPTVEDAENVTIAESDEDGFLRLDHYGEPRDRQHTRTPCDARRTDAITSTPDESSDGEVITSHDSEGSHVVLPFHNAMRSSSRAVSDVDASFFIPEPFSNGGNGAELVGNREGTCPGPNHISSPTHTSTSNSENSIPITIESSPSHRLASPQPIETWLQAPIGDVDERTSDDQVLPTARLIPKEYVQEDDRSVSEHMELLLRFAMKHEKDFISPGGYGLQSFDTLERFRPNRGHRSWMNDELILLGLHALVAGRDDVLVHETFTFNTQQNVLKAETKILEKVRPLDNVSLYLCPIFEDDHWYLISVRTKEFKIKLHDRKYGYRLQVVKRVVHDRWSKIELQGQWSADSEPTMANDTLEDCGIILFTEAEKLLSPDADIRPNLKWARLRYLRLMLIPTRVTLYSRARLLQQAEEIDPAWIFDSVVKDRLRPTIFID